MKLEIRNKLELSEFAYLIVFSFFIFSSIITYSTLNMSRILIYFARVIMLLVVVFFKIKSSSNKLLNILLLICFLFLAVAIKLHSGRWNALDIGMLMIGASNAKFINIAKTYRLVATITIVAIMLMFFLGLIDENIVYRGSVVRHSFGFIYATDLVALFFYILLADFYICNYENKKFTYRYPIYVIIALFSYKMCDARLGTICILMMIPAVLYLKRIRKRITRIEELILKYSISIFAAFTVILVQIYILYPRNKFIERMDALLSYRLYYSKIGVLRYGYKLFGQKVEMHGGDSKDYFFIDSSYMNIILVYGVISLICVCLIFTYITKISIKKCDYLLPFVIFMIAVNSFVGQQLLDIAYDVFLLSFLSKDGNKISMYNLIRRLKL
ncbi:MAG: hypothetical protein PUB76_05585 [Oscillospiraceae bacterium]|nr:hypothetical protein [Oscillospiraceae bacterium]MDD6085428.1 hypothetical protein [Oscillospiraceae bacterium]